LSPFSLKYSLALLNILYAPLGKKVIPVQASDRLVLCLFLADQEAFLSVSPVLNLRLLATFLISWLF